MRRLFRASVYAVQAAIIIGVFVFYIEAVDRNSPPGPVILIGVGLAFFVTVCLPELLRWGYRVLVRRFLHVVDEKPGQPLSFRQRLRNR